MALEGVFLPTRYSRRAFYRGPARCPTHVEAGPARRGRRVGYSSDSTKSFGRSELSQVPFANMAVR